MIGAEIAQLCGRFTPWRWVLMCNQVDQASRDQPWPQLARCTVFIFHL